MALEVWMNSEFIFQGETEQLEEKIEELKAKMEELGFKGDVNYDVIEVDADDIELEDGDFGLEDCGFSVTKMDVAKNSDTMWGIDDEEKKENKPEAESKDTIWITESGEERVYRKDG